MRLAYFVSEIPTHVKDSTAHAIMTVIVKIGLRNMVLKAADSIIFELWSNFESDSDKLISRPRSVYKDNQMYFTFRLTYCNSQCTVKNFPIFMNRVRPVRDVHAVNLETYHPHFCGKYIWLSL